MERTKVQFTTLPWKENYIEIKAPPPIRIIKPPTRPKQ